MGINLEQPILSFLYKNYKGDVSLRQVTSPKIFFGDSEYHGDNTWLMEAYDVNKQEMRTFHLPDIINF